MYFRCSLTWLTTSKMAMISVALTGEMTEVETLMCLEPPVCLIIIILFNLFLLPVIVHYHHGTIWWWPPPQDGHCQKIGCKWFFLNLLLFQLFFVVTNHQRDSSNNSSNGDCAPNYHHNFGTSTNMEWWTARWYRRKVRLGLETY